jgi:hypothetical protein
MIGERGQLVRELFEFKLQFVSGLARLKSNPT